MDWDKLRVFHAVAEAGSFTKAGTVLNLSQSAVSRQISTLEQELRVPLFHRHARGLLPTEQGELLYRTAHEVFARLAMTEAMIAEGRERPKGPLKITTTIGFATVWLVPRLIEFIDTYPEIAVTLLAEDRDLDLSMREADLAIRLRPPTQTDLIQRHLMKVHFHAYAAKSYLKSWGTPKTAEDLDRHRLIVYSNGPLVDVTRPNWLLESGASERSQRRPSLYVNNFLAMQQSVRSGLGIAALPDYIVENESEVVRVLPDLDGPTIDTYFVYPEELRKSKRITVFRDFLLARVKQTSF
jgi:DNA-binding transcriptional LysR family regulator